MNSSNVFDAKYDSFRAWINSGWRRWALKYFFGSLIPLFIPLFYKTESIKNFITDF